MEDIYDNDFLFDTMGYVDGNNVIDIDDDLINISRMFEYVSNNQYDKKIFVSKSEMLKSAQTVLDSLFKLHKVKYISEYVLESIYYKNEGDMLECLKSSSILVSPYSIPIDYCYESKVGKCLTKEDVYFLVVYLNKNKLEYSVTSYIHEIVHTQLDSNSGVIKNYQNNEILPIFVELIAALILDDTGSLFRKVQLCRYKNVSDCIKYILQNKECYNDCVEASVYIVSSLLADNLIEIYMLSNNDERNEMISNIQKVFDGLETIEDLLNKYSVSIETSKRKILNRRY